MVVGALNRSGNLRHRVVTAATPWVASQYSLDGEPHPLEGSVFLDGFPCIFRAGGCESAGGWCERADALLVKAYGLQ